MEKKKVLHWYLLPDCHNGDNGEKEVHYMEKHHLCHKCPQLLT